MVTMRAGVRRRAAAAALAALCALAVLAGVLAGAAGDGDGDHMSPMPFLMNVRYGRSPGGERGARHLEPRADRFFMGTRYGKRSHAVVGKGEGEMEGLVCEYTGVMTLYQCYRAHDRLREEDRSVRERR